MSESALIAAASILTGDRSEDPARQKRTWQDEAWEFYDDSGPLRYGTTWIANMLSKARLQAARMPPGGDEPEPIDSGPAADAIEALAGGIGGQTQMLRSLAIQLTVPGLCYLVGTDQGSNWQIMSADVIRLKEPGTPTNPPVYEIQESSSSWVLLDSETLVVKIWRPHERYPWLPDSPARAALPSLRELRRIGQYIDATLVSRLAGAGIFIFPQEARFPTAPNGSGQHPFVTEILQVMMTAVRKPGTAAQIVPIPVEVPGDLADKFKFLQFASELSDKILEMRESALRQCSIALDIPGEVLTGMGDVNHWGQWQIEESAVKVHAEPLLELITSALTEGYLIPVLEATDEDTEDLVVWADTSELTTRPDRSDDAIQLYDRGELSGEALRRETGMAESDKPDEDELADWAFKKLVANPQLATMALTGLGVDVPEPPQPAQPEPTQTEEPPPPEDETGGSRQTQPNTQGQEAEQPGGGPPQQQASLIDLPRLLALEAYCRRALSIARNRRGNGSKRDLFDGVWSDAHDGLRDAGFNVSAVISAMQSYCDTLIKQELDFDRQGLALAVHGMCADQDVAA